ncbi:MAG: lysophospholipid acyltransferase family protein [Deltaproteobacteria bacterium]|nr:lysophospholipid acyltransferase family protein [Deltaproteobacteria bacterium]
MSLAYQLLRATVRALAWPPLDTARAAGRSLGRLAQRLDEKHRRIVQENLSLSFPEHEAAWVERTATGVFEHIGQVAAELPWLVHATPSELRAATRMHGFEHMREGMARGRGVITLTGHLGNWEWASLVAKLEVPHPSAVVARPLDWPPADRWVNEWRSSTGHQMVPKSSSARALLRILRAGGMAGLLLDQNVDWYDGVWVEFFGRQACTNKGGALLALRTGAVVLPFYSFRAPDGKLDVCFDPEIPLVRTGDKTHDVWANTQNFTRALENIIRRHPEQWFWLHQRWKTKPFQPWPRQNS